MTLPVDDATSLSRLYHLNSEPWLNERAYRGQPYHQEFKDHPAAPRIALPPSTPTALDALAAARASVRAFAHRPLPLATLAGLLRTAYGVIGSAALPGGAFLRRPVPSAGGLYPLEIYVLTQGVTGLADGVHHFDAVGEALACLRAGDWRAQAAGMFYTWPYVAQANAILCFAAVFDRCQSKYGPRGYRYILLEAGHAAQNLCLAATAAGLGALCMGGYRDAALNGLIGLDPLREGVVYTVAAGWPETGWPTTGWPTTG